MQEGGRGHSQDDVQRGEAGGAGGEGGEGGDEAEEEDEGRVVYLYKSTHTPYTSLLPPGGAEQPSRPGQLTVVMPPGRRRQHLHAPRLRLSRLHLFCGTSPPWGGGDGVVSRRGGPVDSQRAKNRKQDLFSYLAPRPSNITLGSISRAHVQVHDILRTEYSDVHGSTCTRHAPVHTSSGPAPT